MLQRANALRMQGSDKRAETLLQERSAVLRALKAAQYRGVMLEGTVLQDRSLVLCGVRTSPFFRFSAPLSLSRASVVCVVCAALGVSWGCSSFYTAFTIYIFTVYYTAEFHASAQCSVRRPNEQPSKRPRASAYHYPAPVETSSEGPSMHTPSPLQ